MKMQPYKIILLFLFTTALAACADDYGDGNSGSDGYGVSGRPDGYLVPQLVSSTLTFNTLESSGWHTCGVISDGTTLCWGDNEFGALGSVGE